MKNGNEKFRNILPSILSIIFGLLFGLYLLFVTKPTQALPGLATILEGGFTDGISGIGILLFTATPIILTGLSVGFSIKTGLFNIGASGQFTVGGFLAILVGIKFSFLPPIIHCLVSILAGALGGAIWGFISGYLKSRFNVSEVISGIMLNYTGMLLVNLLIRQFIYNSHYNRSADVASSALITRDFFEKILPNSRINAAFFIAVVIVVFIKILLDKTTFGYELKITGKNRNASLYAGINDSKNIILSMTIAGTLAGLGAALMYLSDFGQHISVVENVLQYGFTGISVALLGMSNPFGILVAGLFIAQITVGGTYLQLYGFTPDTVDMIIAVIVYCGALVVPIKYFIQKRYEKKMVKFSSTRKERTS